MHRSSQPRTRRLRLSAALFALGGLVLAACGSPATSDGGPDTVVIGAAWPLSGPFAFNGNAVLDGAQAAVDDINESGGIEALGGAHLELRVVDAGSTASEAVASTDRLVNDDRVVAVMGSWLSSLSLAASEVTERGRVPYISESFADHMTDRPYFTHVFDYAPPSSQIADLLLDAAQPSLAEAGIDMDRVALIGDNTAAATPLIDGLEVALGERGIEVALREQWTPPLQDASGIAQKVANGEVDAVLLIAFSFNDVSSIVRSLRARGIDVPVIQNGGQGIVPQWQDLGDGALGLSSFVYTNPIVGSEELTAHMAEATGVPYVWQDQLGGYFAVNVLAAGLEEAGEADREALNDALRNMELTEGPAVDLMPTDVIAFDEGGRITPAFGVLAQWQRVDGELVPCTIYPTEYAVCEPAWQ